MGSSGTSSRPPSGGLPGCNSSTSSSGVSSPGLATKCAVCGVGDSFSVLPKVLPCLHALCQMCWDKQQLNEGIGTSDLIDKGSCCPVCKADCLMSPPAHQGSTASSTSSTSSNSSEHSGTAHDIEALNEAAPRLAHQLNRTLNEARVKAAELKSVVQAAEAAVNKMSGQLSKAQSDVTETYHFYRAALDERREELLRELESVYNSKQSTLNELGQKTQEAVERILKTCTFVERLVKQSSPVEALLFKKELDAKFAALFAFCPPDLNIQSTLDVEFMSNFKAIQIGVRNTYGYIRSSGDPNPPGSLNSNAAALASKQQQPPIARPTSMLLNSNYSVGGVNLNLNNGRLSPGGNLASSQANGSDSHFIAKRFPVASTSNSFGLGLNELGLTSSTLSQTPTYDKWSTNAGGAFDGFQLSQSAMRSGTLDGNSLTPITDPTIFELSKLMTNSSLYPPRSQIKRQKMIYHCKFGEFGVMEGQFTEPSGVAVNAQNDIIVADTNNHRIQIFDKEGRFKFQFGECGKRDGQLLYPNRVSVVKTSGDIIVTERSPTHQIQIYNQYGQFARKFGANVLQHPRGVTVDSKGRIIVVECKVMRVIIFDQMGNVLHKFGCSKHLEFPNGVVVNEKQEIFISDNRAHCVKVFSYEGVFLRQIGGEGLTNYPIGVGINSAGEILIADNHNNFNLTIFTQDGQLISALESKVKHAQCFDVALLDDGSVVLASKDYRLYVYRYVQIPPLTL
nr:EOG090X01W2 [Macrothrix elegans]